MRPHGNAPPFPLLHDFRVRLLDERTNAGERLAAPIAQLLDPRVDQLRGRVLHLPSFGLLSWFIVLERSFTGSIALVSRSPVRAGTTGRRFRVFLCLSVASVNASA